jgi:hypothetical protein
MVAEGKRCSIEGCKRPYRAKGYCNVHFRKWRRGELDAKPRYKICKEEKCKKPMFKKGYCEQHYGAWSASKKPGVEKPAAPAEAPTAAPAAKPATETPPATA